MALISASFYRVISKSPGFALTAIATLSLGIGANTAIFSVVDQVLLNPAGVVKPDRVTAVRVRYDKLALKSIPISVRDFADVEATGELIESAAVLDQGDFNYTGQGVPEQLPGATSAAVAIPVPFTGSGGSASFAIEGRPSAPGDPGPHGDVRYISPGYFANMKIPLRAGRAFTDHDRPGSERVMIIDENLARQYWPNQNPIGQHMRRGQNEPWSRIIGVVGHVKHSSLENDTGKGRYYIPMYQRPTPTAFLLVRTSLDPANLAAAMPAAVLSVDPKQPVHHLLTMKTLVESSLAPRRFVVTLLEFFAVTALLMAALGLYAVISYSVTQRTQEIGVRMALGAQRSEVLKLVVGQGMRLACIKAAIGLAGAFAISRVVQNQLFEVQPLDPVTFALTAFVLAAAAFLASYVPGLRATYVNPVDALRDE